MARVGYARVSTTDQDPSAQIERLKAAGCEIIRSEKVTGTTRNGRSELASVLEFLRHGDELVVTRIDRLARSSQSGRGLSGWEAADRPGRCLGAAEGREGSN